MTANPGELVVMLYDGCIKQLRLAECAIGNQEFPEANKCLQKAQDIVVELIMSLDFHYSISEDLFKLYDFMLLEMRAVNTGKDAGRIAPLIELMSELRGAWDQAKKSFRVSAAAWEE